MQLQFGDEELEHLAYETVSGADGWPAPLLRRYRRVLQMISAATSPADLEALLSLRVLSAPSGVASGATLRIDDEHRLRVSYPRVNSGAVAVIEAVEQD
ncbi:putative proteic killer suppression protein [Microbacterium sp. C448]|nr:putative proteic killer suppression protein [Microbacterium sp. C448]